MIVLAGILVALAVAAVSGSWVSRNVPDEVPNARRYVEFLADAILVIMLGYLLVGYGWGAYSIAGIALLVVSRLLVPFSKTYAALSGAIIGTSFILPADAFLPICLLCLGLNYTVGALSEGPELQWISQPVLAVVSFFAVVFIPAFI